MASRLSNIETLNMELTTRCNLRCPFCARAIFQEYGVVMESQDLLPSCWGNLMIDRVNSLLLCGIFGDPIFYPYLMEFLEYSFRVNPTIKIQIHTNGGAHNTNWWTRLSKLMRGSKVIFALDGLEDTHKIYRVGSSFNKVLKNMQTAIDGGCRVYWQFIVFKHNEHQIQEARNMAMKMGCTDFFMKKSFIYDDRYEKPSLFPNIQSKAEQAQSDIGEIQCRMDFGEIMVMANGDVAPCCEITPFHYNSKKANENLQLNVMNVNDHTIQEIIDDGYLQKFRSEVEDKVHCKRCIKITRHNYHSVESLLEENTKTRILAKINKLREQKKEEGNK